MSGGSGRRGSVGDEVAEGTRRQTRKNLEGRARALGKLLVQVSVMLEWRPHEDRR